VLYNAVSTMNDQESKNTNLQSEQPPEGLDQFFDFIINLEQASLITKKEILMAFIELFECA
jgi:hypothetical protein